MLLRSYRKNMSLSECNSNFGSLQCIAHLEEDIGEVLPYLNAVLQGFQYTESPRSLMLKRDGRVIVLYPHRIAINSVKDESDAERTLQWLKETINETWRKRAEIQPSFEGKSRPSIIRILRLLGETDCRPCGESSCVTFAIQMAEGNRAPEDCEALDEESKARVDAYLRQFDLNEATL